MMWHDACPNFKCLKLNLTSLTGPSDLHFRGSCSGTDMIIFCWKYTTSPGFLIPLLQKMLKNIIKNYFFIGKKNISRVDCLTLAVLDRTFDVILQFSRSPFTVHTHQWYKCINEHRKQMQAKRVIKIHGNCYEDYVN